MHRKLQKTLSKKHVLPEGSERAFAFVFVHSFTPSFAYDCLSCVVGITGRSRRAVKKAISVMERSLSWPSLGPGLGWKVQWWGMGSHGHLPATQRRAVVWS